MFKLSQQTEANELYQFEGNVSAFADQIKHGAPLDSMLETLLNIDNAVRAMRKALLRDARNQGQI